MAAESAKIVDLQAYRNARSKPVSPAHVAEMAPFSGMQPMMVWVPVWTFFPMMPGQWVHAQ